MNQKNPTFIRTVATETLISFLREAKEDQLITYFDMNRSLGRVGHARPNELDTAVKALLNEGHVFETVRSFGIKLCNPKDRLKLSSVHINRTRKATKKVLKKLATVDPKQVDEKEYNSACAKVALIAAATDSSVHRSIETASVKVLPNQSLTRQQLSDIFH